MAEIYTDRSVMTYSSYNVLRDPAQITDPLFAVPIVGGGIRPVQCAPGSQTQPNQKRSSRIQPVTCYALKDVD